jgi:hypothetical protein
MTRVECLQEIEDFVASAFTEHDAIGSHTERLPQEIPKTDCTKAVGVRRACNK